MSERLDLVLPDVPGPPAAVCPVCGGRHERLLRTGQRMLTVREAAAHLRSSDDYVYKLVRAKKLPANTKSSRRWLIAEADLFAFLYE